VVVRDVYHLERNSIVKNGSATDRVGVGDIVAWSEYPEMVFDIVCINLANGEAIQWLDDSGDLVKILRENVGDKQR
jgi:hypothetical protein